MKNKRWLVSDGRISSLIVHLLSIVVYGSVCSAALIYASPGDLDTTFGSGGKVLMANYQSPTRVQIQPDGKIVTLTANYWDDGYSVFSRLNADGTSDTTFGTDGYIDTANYGIIFDFIIQPDGKLLGVGESFLSGSEKFALFRFNSNGALDTSFGANGIASPPFNYGPRTAGWGVALQKDGKIVAKGTADTYQGGRFLIVRYYSDGVLDTSFGTGGIVDESAVGIAEEKILVQQDNKLIVSGWRFIARYNPNGSIDNSFGTNGHINVDVDNIQLQEDGKIVVLTWADQLKRYNQDGTIDSSFGLNGVVSITSLSPGTPYGASGAFAVHKNGKMSVAGSLNDAFAVSRYNADGGLDATFGTNGVVTTPLGIGSSSGRISALVFQPDGKIVAAGNHWPSSELGSVTLLRYEGDAISQRTVGGRVLTSGGLGIRNATVSITDPVGVRRTATTSTLGFYSFENVEAGSAIQIAVASKRFRFEPRSETVSGNLSEINFTALE
jgi:uncharacterized delta-60 repeat protein